MPVSFCLHRSVSRLAHLADGAAVARLLPLLRAGGTAIRSLRALLHRQRHQCGALEKVLRLDLRRRQGGGSGSGRVLLYSATWRQASTAGCPQSPGSCHSPAGRHPTGRCAAAQAQRPGRCRKHTTAAPAAAFYRAATQTRRRSAGGPAAALAPCCLQAQPAEWLSVGRGRLGGEGWSPGECMTKEAHTLAAAE